MGAIVCKTVGKHLMSSGEFGLIEIVDFFLIPTALANPFIGFFLMNMGGLLDMFSLQAELRSGGLELYA